MHEKPRVNVKVEPRSRKDYATVEIHLKGGFPLSRNFYVRTDVNFNWLYVRKLKYIEVMYEKPRVNVKVERGSTFYVFAKAS